jgi:ubiquitin-like protein Pup
VSQQQTHARVSQPGSDAGQRTTDDDLVDQAIDDAMERAVSDNETLEHTDDLLDEIDRILTEEEEFAVRYVQKGGE